MDEGNFAFLQATDEPFARLGVLAERYFFEDPNSTLLKLRQFAEIMSQVIAARAGKLQNAEEGFADLLRRLKAERIIPKDVAELFHHLRMIGNRAAHEGSGNHSEALVALKVARELGVWFYRAFDGQPGFRPGPFIPPKLPPDPTAFLEVEIARLNAEVVAARTEAERVRDEARQHAQATLTAEQLATREAEDRESWKQLALSLDDDLKRLSSELLVLQGRAIKEPAAITATISQGQEAARGLHLDESTTRALIDQQLRDAGWEADTDTIRFSKGARPAKGRNQAIAEWPTATGPADYALFVDTVIVGVVEAKRQHKNVMEVLPQAERYAKGIQLSGAHLAGGAPWEDFLAPFVFSTNGRPYLKQLEHLSGIWRRDVRRRQNPALALSGWPSPAGVLSSLSIDKDAAHVELAKQPFDFGFSLRPYQQSAIETVERELAGERRSMLLAMATGTGKTKLAIALLYRLITAKRFRRVCFVVDRSALGEQAAREFSTTKVVSGRAFADIFGIKGLTDVAPDPDTRVHICTIQGLLRRILYSEEPGDAPQIDQYDLIIVDECHRGYLLDREMSDAELSFRNQDDYISKYRRVLEYFDAVKIGLTATPALHTVDIFGSPIFTYSYREAVIDGFLVDHEPPIRIGTALSESGIHFLREESVEFVRSPTGEVTTTVLPDNIDFDVDQFNKAVITQAFNGAIARELTRHIDPSLPGKTLVFAVSDAHADIVVKELRDAFREAYGDIDDTAIRKVTGSVDKVGKLILSFRNDALPQIAVTVDLLTTGVDVPRITNLVFLRRVNSRILYEQMLGRATRLCPEIGKDVFRIFDAVDLYENLQNLTDMKPVAASPTITLSKLFEEVVCAADAEHREIIRGQIIVKLRRRLKTLPSEARAQFEKNAGQTPEEALEHIRHAPYEELAAWAKAWPRLGPILDWTSEDGTPHLVPISYHPDEVTSVTRGYGSVARPEDFLDQFSRFIRENVNKIAALKLVVQRPQDLTRNDLRTLRLELDAQGFTEAKIKRAWAESKNEEIAASIIGFIRQAALGDALVPFEQRVTRALESILRTGRWTDVQKRWLERIARQAALEVVVDHAAFDAEPFAALGGYGRINRVFEGRLDSVVAQLNSEIWKETA